MDPVNNSSNHASVNPETAVLKENKPETSRTLRGFSKAWGAIKWCGAIVKMLVFSIPRISGKLTDKLKSLFRSCTKKDLSEQPAKQNTLFNRIRDATRWETVISAMASTKYDHDKRFAITLQNLNLQLANIPNVHPSISKVSLELHTLILDFLKHEEKLNRIILIQAHSLPLLIEWLGNKCIAHAKQGTALPPELQNSWKDIKSLWELEHLCTDTDSMFLLASAVGMQTLHMLYNLPEMTIKGEQRYTKSNVPFQEAFYTALDLTFSQIWETLKLNKGKMERWSNIENPILRNINMALVELKKIMPSLAENLNPTICNEAKKTHHIQSGKIDDANDFLEHEIMIRGIEKLQLFSPNTTEQSLTQPLAEVCNSFERWMAVAVIEEKELKDKGKLKDTMATLKPVLDQYFLQINSN